MSITTYNNRNHTKHLCLIMYYKHIPCTIVVVYVHTLCIYNIHHIITISVCMYHIPLCIIITINTVDEKITLLQV